MYCMRMTICVYFEVWTIEYNELVTFSFLLLHLDFKHASTRPLLAIVNVYKIMIVLGSSTITALFWHICLIICNLDSPG